MGGKPRRRKPSKGKAANVAETPGNYHAGGADESREARDAAVDLFPTAHLLSAMEREAVGWGLTGKKNSVIATITGKSKRTIEAQIAKAWEKLGVEDREGALLMLHHLEKMRLLGEIAHLERKLASSEQLVETLRRQLRDQP